MAASGEVRPVDILRISGRAADGAPGRSPSDTVADPEIYAELAATPHWRRILSTDYSCPLRVMGLDFASPRHAMAHAQYMYDADRRTAIPARLETVEERRSRTITAESLRAGSWDAVKTVTLTPTERRADIIGGLREIAHEFILDSGSELSRETPESVISYIRCMESEVSGEWTEKNRSLSYREARLAVFRVIPAAISPRDVARAWVRDAQFAPGTEARRVLLATGDAELWRGTSWVKPRREASLEALRSAIREDEAPAENGAETDGLRSEGTADMT